MLWLSIDPGIAGTGFAVMEGKRLLWFGSVYPEKELQRWELRASNVLLNLRQKLVHMTFSRVYIEWPSQFTGRRGLAATNSNDILKLACFIGRLSELFIAEKAIVVLVPVQRWKGSLPKPVVAARAKQFFKIKKLKSHAADAVGLAQYVLQEGAKC